MKRQLLHTARAAIGADAGRFRQLPLVPWPPRKQIAMGVSLVLRCAFPQRELAGEQRHTA